MKLIINDIVIDNIKTPVYTDQVELVVQSGNFHNNVREVHTQELPEQEGVKFTIYFNDGAFVNGLAQISGVGLPYVPIIPENPVNIPTILPVDVPLDVPAIPPIDIPVEALIPESIATPTEPVPTDNIPTHTENF